MSASISSSSKTNGFNFEDEEGKQEFIVVTQVSIKVVFCNTMKIIAQILLNSEITETNRQCSPFEQTDHIEIKHEFLVIKCQNGYVRIDWGPQGRNIRVNRLKKSLFKDNENARPKWNIIRKWKHTFSYQLCLQVILNMTKTLQENQEYDIINFNCKDFSRQILQQCKSIKND